MPTVRSLLTVSLSLLSAIAAPVRAQDSRHVDAATCPPSKVPLAEGLAYLDNLTVRSPKNFLRDHAAKAEGGLVHAVIEIPAGTDEKWEVKPGDGVMRWDLVAGKPRQVKYLAYPFNYGMVPQTCLGRELGGDGDPLDIVVLGPALPRGTVVAVKVLGVLRMVDSGEQDDKIIAVSPDSPLAAADSLAQLDVRFPGILTIVRTFFENYKGPGVMQFEGCADAAAAAALLQRGCESYAKSLAAGGRR